MKWFSNETEQQKLINALCKACKKGDIEATKKLIAQGADVNGHGALFRFKFCTPLIVAATYNRVDIVKLLLSESADVNRTNMHDTAALSFAANNGSLESLSLLINKGAKLDHINKYGCTALHLAADNNRLESLKILVEAGANVHILTPSLKRASQIAKGLDYKKCATFLEEKEKALLPAPAPVPAIKTGWQLEGDAKISFVETLAGYRLTSIFDFAAKKYHQFSQNIESKAESQVMKLFGEFTEMAMLEEARAELIRLGGNPPELLTKTLLKKGV